MQTIVLYRAFNNGRKKAWISICVDLQCQFFHRSLWNLTNKEVQKKAVRAISLHGDADSLPLCDPSLRLMFYKMPIKHVNQLSSCTNATFFFYFQQPANKGTLICDDFSCFKCFEMRFWPNYQVVTTFDYLRKCSINCDGNVRQATMQ